MKSSTWILEEGLGNQTICSSREVCEDMKVKSKMQQRLQGVRNTRNVDYPLRQATGTEQSQLKSEAMWTTMLDLRLLEFTLHNLPKVLYTELQHLMLILLGSGLALV